MSGRGWMNDLEEAVERQRQQRALEPIFGGILGDAIKVPTNDGFRVNFGKPRFPNEVDMVQGADGVWRVPS